MRIRHNTFRGIRPRLDPELLEGNEAQTAENVMLDKGTLRPWDNELLNDSLENNSLVRTVFLYEGAYWLEFTADVDLVLAPLSGDTTGRFYYSGDGIPKKSNLTEATTGSGAMPINFYPLALPSPKPVLTGTPGAGGTGDARNILYVWTVVSSWGEESVPSPASAIIEAKNGQTVALAGMTLVWQAATAYVAGDFVVSSSDETYIYKCVTAGTSGALEPIWGETVDEDTEDNGCVWRCYENNISYKRIYRYNSGDEFGAYLYVDQMAAADTTYSDETEDTDLGEALPSATWDPPPDELTGITYIGNGMMAGFSGKDLYVSEPWRFWAFPTDYIIAFPYTIVAIKEADETTVVMTEQGAFVVTGKDPASLDSTPLSDPKACVSKRGVVSFNVTQGETDLAQVIYPTPEGLCMVHGSTEALITKNQLSKKDWQSYYPTTMHGHIHKNKYFGFYSYGTTEGCVVFDFITGDLTTLDLYASAVYVDHQTDTMYFVKGTSEVLLLENGVTYPARANMLLLEDGLSALLLE
ncbi:hypothetical protein KKE60_04205 [Patescibacteria group bacterium]|nr:hypothetical protein [Patescibacteria group bacterium]